MSVAPFTRRVPKQFTKTVTFTALGDGAVGTVTIGTVTGGIYIDHMSARCTTLLTGSGVVELGVVGNTASLIPQTTATDIDANEYWQDATPELGCSPSIVAQQVCRNIVLTVSSATVTAGVIEFVIWWLPDSSDGNLA